MRRLGALLLALTVALALMPTGLAQTTNSLQSETTHTMVIPPVFSGEEAM